MKAVPLAMAVTNQCHFEEVTFDLRSNYDEEEEIGQSREEAKSRGTASILDSGMGLASLMEKREGQGGRVYQ